MLKQYQKITFLVLLFLVFSAILYGIFVEPNRVVVKRIIIRDDHLFNAWHGLRIVQVSDLHITKIGIREKLVIRKIAEIEPDIVCVTGDLAQWGSSYSEVVRFLKSLKSRYGVYVVLGDSDMSTGRVRCFFCHRSGSIHKVRKNPVFLRNNWRDVKIQGNRIIRILGVSPGMKPDEFYAFWKEETEAALSDKRIPILVLSHFSSLWKLVPADEHVLWLSGDTHGGQVWLPEFLWPIVFRGKDYEHLRGLFTSGRGKWLYVNQGLGTTAEFPLRIGVPPEITVITFEPEQ